MFPFYNSIFISYLFYVFLLFILRALGCKIAIEIPTYPYANSFDSRLLGCFKVKDILSKKGFVLFPFKNMKEVD